MVWALFRYNGIGYVRGEPVEYALINEHGIFVFASKMRQWFPIPSHYWIAPLFDPLTKRLSKLEALILFGLYDGNANIVGKEE